METDYTLIYIGAALTTIGTLISFLLDQVKRYQDKKEARENRFYQSRTAIYGKSLACLRRIGVTKDSVVTLEESREINDNLSEAILYAQEEVRTKLIKAIKCIAHGKNWVKDYDGKDVGVALHDIEKAMKAELGIDYLKSKKEWKFENLIKNPFARKAGKTQKS